MISKPNIKKLAVRKGVRTGYIEKDYVNTWILYMLYKENWNIDFYFKGGTALSKVYQPSLNRFSEDLDFTLGQKPNANITDDIMNSLNSVERKTGISFDLRDKHRAENNPNVPGGNIGLKIKYNAILDQSNTTEIDLDWGSKLFFPSKTQSLAQENYDTPEFKMKTYSLKEIFAEKIRCLFMRPKTRDM